MGKRLPNKTNANIPNQSSKTKLEHELRNNSQSITIPTITDIRPKLKLSLWQIHNPKKGILNDGSIGISMNNKFSLCKNIPLFSINQETNNVTNFDNNEALSFCSNSLSFSESEHDIYTPMFNQDNSYHEETLKTINTLKSPLKSCLDLIKVPYKGRFAKKNLKLQYDMKRSSNPGSMELSSTKINITNVILPPTKNCIKIPNNIKLISNYSYSPYSNFLAVSRITPRNQSNKNTQIKTSQNVTTKLSPYRSNEALIHRILNINLKSKENSIKRTSSIHPKSIKTPHISWRIIPQKKLVYYETKREGRTPQSKSIINKTNRTSKMDITKTYQLLNKVPAIKPRLNILRTKEVSRDRKSVV